MMTRFFCLMLAGAGLVLAAAPVRADYALILPLQYNAYQPVSARALGCGNCWATQAGLGSLFADPAGLSGRPGISAEIGSSGMSAFRSHDILNTRPARMVPSTVIAGWGVRNHYLAFGARRAQRVTLDFSDPRRPQMREQMDLGLDQLRGGWNIGIADVGRLALALGFDRVAVDWSDPSHRLAQASVNSQSFTLGFAADIWRGLSFGLFHAAKTTFDASTGFDYLDTMRTLDIYGTVPSVSGLAARYQLDTGFVATGQLDFTGWSSVIDGYLGTMDWHVGLELEAWRWLTLRAGGYSLATPLDPVSREGRPEFHNLYFLTAGAGVRWWRINADLGAATSYPFSGRGLNQNIVAFSLGYAPQEK
jgi:hypothetical protein